LSLEYLALLLVLIGFYASAFAQEADVAPDAAGSANSVRVRHTETQGFEQFVAYWTTEDSWHSELQLKNNQPGRDLTVLPALRTPDGAETALPAVTIKSQEVKSIDIGAVAPQLGATYGSVVLRYSSTGARAFIPPSWFTILDMPSLFISMPQERIKIPMRRAAREYGGCRIKRQVTI
jgi:hypothetical protein